MQFWRTSLLLHSLDAEMPSLLYLLQPMSEEPSRLPYCRLLGWMVICVTSITGWLLPAMDMRLLYCPIRHVTPRGPTHCVLQPNHREFFDILRLSPACWSIPILGTVTFRLLTNPPITVDDIFSAGRVSAGSHDTSNRKWYSAGVVGLILDIILERCNWTVLP